MSGWDWITIAVAMGLACLPVCRWWVRELDCREPKYTAVWRNLK
jgi:hypothetical protein